jgi:hypothetical protein
MVTALYDDSPMPGKDTLQASQPPQFDCTIQVAKDQQRWHLLDGAQSLLQVGEVVMALRGALVVNFSSLFCWMVITCI